MILRKLADAIRQQNWFTVVLEVAIVVVGIFVGLQVSNWNEARLDRVRELASLQRLLSESENSVAYIQREVEKGASRIASQRDLLSIMFSDSPIPGDTASAELGFVTLNFLPAMTPAQATFDELTAAGGLRLIRSSYVREMISLYYADLDWFLAQLSYFRDFSISAGNDPSIAAAAYVTAEYDPSDEMGRQNTFDWSGLRSDPYLGTLFANKFRNQIVMNGNREQLLNRAKIMCKAIADAIHEKCTPALGDGSQ